MTVAAILKHKGGEVARTAPEATVAEVVAALAKRRIGALLVLDGADHLVGIISERDIVASLAEYGAATLQRTAAQLMTSELHTATMKTTVPQAMEMMTNGRFRHLPVVENDRLLGIVSIGDVVLARISQQEQEVDSLKAYVAGAS